MSLTVRILALTLIAVPAAATAAALGGTYHAAPVRRVAIVGDTVITTRDVATARRTFGGKPSRSTVVTALVNDAVLVDEARRLHLLRGLSLRALAARPDLTAVLNRRLYGYAARSVPLPADRRARAYAKLVADARGEDADAIEDGMGASAATVANYDSWLTRRDEVASAWFGRLYARYRSLTTYPRM